MLTHLMFLGVKPLGIVSNRLQDDHESLTLEPLG
jgi:hypothetical protein